MRNTSQILGLIILLVSSCTSRTDSQRTCKDFKENIEIQITKLYDFRVKSPDDLSFLEDSLPRLNQDIFILIQNNKNELVNCELDSDFFTFIYSQDRKLGFISWDTEQGGTMIEFTTVKMTKELDSIHVDWYRTESLENSFEDFYEIKSLKSSIGETLYLVKAYGQGSSSLRHLSIKAFKIENGLIPVSVFPDNKSEIFVEYILKNDNISFDIEIVESEQKIRLPLIDSNGQWTKKFKELKYNGEKFTYLPAHNTGFV